GRTVAPRDQCRAAAILAVAAPAIGRVVPTDRPARLQALRPRTPCAPVVHPAAAAPLSLDPSPPPHAVQPRPIVPQYLPLRRLGERQLHERLDGVRVLRVGVRVVGREDQVLVAEPLHVLLDRRLIRLDGEEAARAEVLGPLPPHLRHLVAPHPLPVLVEAMEEPRRPAAVALEEPDAETREALEHPAGTEAHGAAQ